MSRVAKSCRAFGIGEASPRRHGAILIEVVLAITLFAATATVVLGGLNASAGAVRQMRVEAQAADMAVTLLSEIQIGLVGAVDDGPRHYEDPTLAGWTWKVAVAPVDQEVSDSGLRRVVVTVASDKYSYSLTQLMTVKPKEEQVISGSQQGDEQ